MFTCKISVNLKFKMLRILPIDNDGQDVGGDAKLRGEWSENGLW